MGKKRQVFVYGTLRPGHFNHDRFGSGAVTNIVNHCYIEGFKMYNVDGKRPIYPVIVPGDPEDRVYGDLLTIKVNTRWWSQVFSMEVGAGYELEQHTVHVRPAIGHSVEAGVFVYQRKVKGVHIPSGDWHDFVPRKALAID